MAGAGPSRVQAGEQQKLLPLRGNWATDHPLLYAAITKPQLCVHMVRASWVLGFALLSYWLLFLSELSFCGSNIPHFLSDNSPLFTLSCSDTSLLWKIDSDFLPCVMMGYLCLTLAFDICTIFSVLHLPAASGRKKALTTCSSHPINLSIACGSCIALYTCPAENLSLRIKRTAAPGNKSGILAMNKPITRARTKLFP
ncbi:LOW QUALITY PROTEIN: olfactory receptor 6C3-like [Sylvia borin]